MHIHRYYDDISCAQQLGSNSLRLSLEWSRIMPYGPGRVDEAAVQRYCDILDRCAEAGLEPMVTLHHFVHPQWFEELGGFEREENIRYGNSVPETGHGRLIVAHALGDGSRFLNGGLLQKAHGLLCGC